MQWRSPAPTAHAVAATPAPPAPAESTPLLARLNAPVAVGSVTGIKVRVHPLLPLTTVVQALGYALSMGARGFGLGVLVFGPCLWAAVLFHELWHCWAARRLGIHVHEILLWPLGGIAFIGQSPTPCADLAVAAAGPGSHVPAVLFWLALLAAANRGALGDVDANVRTNFFGALCGEALLMNGAMAVFNLVLPCYPLDGGRIVADLLQQCGVLPQPAALVVVVLSAAILALLVAFGLYRLAYGGANGILVLLLAVWMGASTFQLNSLRAQGLAHTHPLFASGAIAAQADAARAGGAPVAPPDPAGGGWRGRLGLGVAAPAVGAPVGSGPPGRGGPGAQAAPSTPSAPPISLLAARAAVSRV